MQIVTSRQEIADLVARFRNNLRSKLEQEVAPPPQLSPADIASIPSNTLQTFC